MRFRNKGVAVQILATLGLAALASGCPDEYSSTDTGAAGDGAVLDGKTGPDGKGKPGDGPKTKPDKRHDGPKTHKDTKPPPPDTKPHPDTKPPCKPPLPAKANFVDTCKLSHDQKNTKHLSSKTPAATAAVTVRLQTQAGDVQKVYLRAWTGFERQLKMTKESTAAGADVYRATLRASDRPIYYRFTLVDGSATLYLTRAGPSKGKPSGKTDFYVAPVSSGKTVHYKTDFSKPQLRVRSGATYITKAMVFAGSKRAGVTGVGAAGKELLFHIRDAATQKEDHPPGGGDYRVPPDVAEAWLELGTVFDVPPETAKLDIIDCHTHPYDKVNGKLYLDSKPLIAQLPKHGIKRAISMVPGSLSSQKSYMKALHKAHRWIVPLVWVVPGSHTVSGVEDLLKNHGFKGLKFHPSVHSFKADSAALDPYMKLAAKYRVPVQFHSATDSNSWPSRIVTLAKRHPSVPVVMVHTELGKTNKTNTLNQIKGVKNIYAETSWTNPESIQQAMKILDSSRTMFGTDATVDGNQQFSKKSIANPYGQYVYTIPAVMAEVKKKAHPGAWANWAYLTTVRLYAWRFRPDADLYDTDGDGQPDISDGDDDNDGKPDGSDPAPKNPGK